MVLVALPMPNTRIYWTRVWKKSSANSDYISVNVHRWRLYSLTGNQPWLVNLRVYCIVIVCCVSRATAAVIWIAVVTIHMSRGWGREREMGERCLGTRSHMLSEEHKDFHASPFRERNHYHCGRSRGSEMAIFLLLKRSPTSVIPTLYNTMVTLLFG